MLSDNTKSIQQAFSSYCRTGEENDDLPVQSAERLGHYRRLVFNVVLNTLTQAYPITKKQLGKKEWYTLVHRFFAEHSCQHTQVWRMPKELIDFVSKSGFHSRVNTAHLPELLMLEWLEIEIHTEPDVDLDPFVPEIQDLLREPLRTTPYYRMLEFKYPVHKVHEINPADHPGSYFLFLFRDNQTGKVHFTHIQPLYATLLDTTIKNPDATPFEVITATQKSTLAFDASPAAIQQVADQFTALLTHLHKRNFIVGKAIY